MVSVKILLTGFNKFGPLSYNPSELVVTRIGRLAQRSLATELVPTILPTEYDKASEIIRERIKTLAPDVVIGTGVSPSRPTICLERIALNIDDVEVADNAGSLREGSAIDPDAPLALQTNCDLKRVQKRLIDQGFSSTISTHAGTYVCNHVYYVALLSLQQSGSAAKCMFVHLPLVPGEGSGITSDAHQWNIRRLVHAVQLVIVELINQARIDRGMVAESV
jgi:pyroglutamyl-peptidase